jgi:diguanylate cyclase (GGDEF)-like protein/PAS domain S-box-containing protein
LSSVALGPYGAATIRTTDLALVSRFPDTSYAVGSRGVSKQLSDIMRTQSESGQYIAATALDGIERSNAYRRLQNYPFYVIVGLATDDYLGGWKKNILMVSGLAALAILMTCVAALSVFRTNRRLVTDVSQRIAQGIKLAKLNLDLIHSKQELQAESEKNLALLRNASDGIYILDPEGNILEVSDSFCSMLGYRREEMIGMNVSQWDAGSVKGKELLAAVRRQLETPARSQFETRHRRKDGTIFDVEVSGFPLKLGGKPVLFNSSRDITERRKNEQQLRIAATAFESQEGMLITDANSAILQVNNSFTKITGYSLEEIIGKNPRILSSGRQDASFYAAMWGSINNTGAWEGEIWNRRKNGDVYPEHLTITAVKNADGAVTNYVATITDITLSLAAADEIKNLAYFDSLTGLPNRRLLQDRLQQALASCSRNGKEGAILFIDLDNFKDLNDAHGHEIGDLLLEQVGGRLIAGIRQGDTVSRLGGDEFVVMLEDLSEDPIVAAKQAEIVANKILDNLNQPYQLGAHLYHGTTSIGVTLFSGPQQSEELMKQADIAMYQAKKAGRNTIRFFDRKMQDTINERSFLEAELRKAIELHRFRLYYQIQLDSSGQPYGAEALIRCLHPERGTIPPEQFIPLAEETGLILPIGQWVLETACIQLKAWQKNELARELILSINVSAKQFREVDFVEQVRDVIQRHAINPNLLKLELTESMLLEDVENTIAIMNALRKIGIGFSLDDFGTGYSSLQYLRRLPLHQLKIDQSFVRDIAVDNSDKAIVCTIIAMAKNLNLEVIAEGVETQEQRQFLLKNGCTHYQGYLFSRPLPIDQFEALLASDL